MFKNNKKTKKIISLLNILVFISIEILPFGAAAADLTDPSSLVGEGISITDIVGPINSADNDPTSVSNKQQGPKVTVTFNSTGVLQQGTKVTATAAPGFFNNLGTNPLYYTWYLKRSGCELEKNVSADDSCNFDGDDKITVNDWKIAAAKIIVAGSFDSEQVDYSSSGESDGHEAFPEFNKSDGWRNDFLKEDDGEFFEENDDDADNCYVQSSESGRIFELRETKESFSECPEGYHRACVSKQSAQCSIINPDYSCFDAKAAVPPSSYTISKGIIDPVTSIFNACAISSEQFNGNTINARCEVTDVKNFKAEVACRDSGATPICVSDSNNTELKNSSASTVGVIVGTKPNENKESNDSKICSAVAKPFVSSDPVCSGISFDKIFFPNTDPLFSATQEECKTIVDKMVDGEKDEAGNIVIAGNASLRSTCSFEKDVNLCKHLFPRFPKSKVTVDGREIDLGDDVSGDGDFTADEKKFWGTDPSKDSTTGLGNDEARVVGMNVDKFEWLYSSGDQVGVVVEGDSVLPTEHDDSAYKRMWAFSNGKCDLLENLESNSNVEDNQTGFYVENVGDKQIGFLTTEVDLNDCLEDNLLDPKAESPSRLSIQLDAIPENPVNDPNGRGDILNVNSNAMNFEDPENLLYRWSVQKSKDGSTAPIDTTSWIDITDDLIENGSFTAIEREGMGKNGLAINLNIPESMVKEGIDASKFSGVFYLRIKLKTTGTAVDGGQNAEGAVVVRVKQQGNEIIAYPVTATDDGMLSMNKGLSGDSLEICSDSLGKSRCFVTKNSIIGLEIASSGSDGLSNFSWQVNGNEMTCNENISTSCSSGGNKLFLPILGNEGEAVNVVAKAVNSANEAIEISRRFIIGNSQLQITAVDENSSCSLQCLANSSICPKYLGHYNNIEFDGARYPDCSYEVWETKEGVTLTFAANGQTGFDWTIDGQAVPEFRDRNKVQLRVDKSVGESYNIGLVTRVLPDNTRYLNNIRRALYKNWNVSPEETIESDQSANIQVNVAASGGQALANTADNGFAASIITHLPQQFMFLLKILLTSFLLLAITSLLFAIMPENAFEKRA